eukprot:1616767-Rhodomonas_salina.1
MSPILCSVSVGWNVLKFENAKKTYTRLICTAIRRAQYRNTPYLHRTSRSTRVGRVWYHEVHALLGLLSEHARDHAHELHVMQHVIRQRARKR